MDNIIELAVVAYFVGMFVTAVKNWKEDITWGEMLKASMLWPITMWMNRK